MPVYVKETADRCLHCKVPMCQKGCPVHTDIPQIITLFQENKLREAGKMLFENNPMSLVCSIVCDHNRQCRGNCVLGKKNAPINFSVIEQFISDAYFDSMELEKKPPKGKKAAVIGGGPAGITVAFKLIAAGYEVTIFEGRDDIGGVLRYGIPDFRLPRSICDRYRSKLLECGVKIRPNTVIGGSLEINNLFRDGYSAVFVGTGVWRSKTLGIKGESLPNVHYSMDFLMNPNGYNLGENVAIIGMGNAAMDVARVALRHGSRHVTLYARSKRVTASPHEFSYAQLEGAEMVFGKAITEITEEGPVFKTAIFDENDRVVGYEDELDYVKSDSTVISISNGPKNKLILTTPGLEANEQGLLITDENCMTTVEGVFAAGDVVQGANTVVNAVEEAKRAADGMIRYLESL